MAELKDILLRHGELEPEEKRFPVRVLRRCDVLRAVPPLSSSLRENEEVLESHATVCIFREVYPAPELRGLFPSGEVREHHACTGHGQYLSMMSVSMPVGSLVEILDILVLASLSFM